MSIAELFARKDKGLKVINIGLDIFYQTLELTGAEARLVAPSPAAQHGKDKKDTDHDR